MHPSMSTKHQLLKKNWTKTTFRYVRACLCHDCMQFFVVTLHGWPGVHVHVTLQMDEKCRTTKKRETVEKYPQVVIGWVFFFFFPRLLQNIMKTCYILFVSSVHMMYVYISVRILRQGKAREITIHDNMKYGRWLMRLI